MRGLYALSMGQVLAVSAAASWYDIGQLRWNLPLKMRSCQDTNVCNVNERLPRNTYISANLPMGIPLCTLMFCKCVSCCMRINQSRTPWADLSVRRSTFPYTLEGKHAAASAAFHGLCNITWAAVCSQVHVIHCTVILMLPTQVIIMIHTQRTIVNIQTPLPHRHKAKTYLYQAQHDYKHSPSIHSFIHSLHAFRSVDQVRCSRHSMAALQPALSWDFFHHVYESPAIRKSSLT